MNCRIRLFLEFIIKRTARRVPHVEQDLLSLSEHVRSLQVFGGVRVAFSFLSYIVYWVVFIVCLPVCFCFVFFCHGVVSLFSIYEFYCPSGIFCSSLITDYTITALLVVDGLPVSYHCVYTFHMNFLFLLPHLVSYIFLFLCTGLVIS